MGLSMNTLETRPTPALSQHQAKSVTASLASTSLFRISHLALPGCERTELSFQRAKAIAQAYGLTAQDIVFLRSKFWTLHTDQICSMDGVATSYLTIQYNLVAGTLAPFASERLELQSLLQQVLDFDISAHFLLSEVSHGLDSPNLETTATLLPSGEFELHTPNPRAAKWMPPAPPAGSIPQVAIVIAQLIVAGESVGVRPFVVAFSDGQQICSGIRTQVISPSGGASDIHHSLVSFDHVHLPFEALLGTLDIPSNLRQNFLRVIWRVGISSLAFSNLTIATFKNAIYATGRFSIRHMVANSDGLPIPVIAQRSQQVPIMHALAQAFVLDAYGKQTSKMFSTPRMDPRIKHGIAAALKTVVALHCQAGLHALAERCGAQGVFEYHEIMQIQLEMRGVALNEGDVPTLCTRLASELLIRRYGLPPPSDPSSFLARHEAGLFDEVRSVILSIGDNQDSSCDAFHRLVLPFCQPLIQAIGHRMAYEAAVQAHVDSDLIALYVAGALKHDPSWYVEHLGITRRQIAEMEDRALGAVVPRLEELLEETGAREYCTSSIVSDEAWATFVEGLTGYEGNTVFSVRSESDKPATSESPFSRL